MFFRTLVKLLVLVINGVGYVRNDANIRLACNRESEQ